MGYDMQSKLDKGDNGYYRFNIWGMGRMRDIMVQADPKLGDDHILKKFCSNDGWVVGEGLGKKIAKALRAFAVKGREYTHHSYAFKKEDVPAGAVNVKKSHMNSYDFDLVKKLGDEEIADIIEFAEYNEKYAPYEVW